MSDVGFNERMESVMEAIEPADDVQHEVPEAIEPEQALEDTPVDADEIGEPGDETEELSQTDDREPVIDPPDSWPADAREKFAALPGDLKKVIADREAEQKSAFNRTINEAAEAKRRAETTGQQLAETLNTYLTNIAAFDPILNEGLKTNWNELAQTDPLAWVEKKAQFDQRLQDYDQAKRHQQELGAQEMAQRKILESQKLLAAIPEWQDSKAYEAERPAILETGRSYGFTDAELSNVLDHRAVRMLRDATLYRKGQAETKAVEAKKVVPFKGKTLAPGGGVDSGGKQAIAKKLAAAHTMHERAEILAASLGD